MRAFPLRYLRHFTYGGLFTLLAVAGLGVPAPQDVTLLLAGYLIHRGLLEPSATVPVCVAGAVAGDAIGFWLARTGAARLKRVRLIGELFTSAHFARAERALARNGALTIAVARNVAGVRTVVFATAAATGIPFARFLLWDVLSAIPNVAVLLGLGVLFSDRLKTITVRVSRAESWIALGVLALVGAAVLLSRLRREASRRRALRSGPSVAPTADRRADPREGEG